VGLLNTPVLMFFAATSMSGMGMLVSLLLTALLAMPMSELIRA
jgi:hypothetical protein